jgi:hypothetical protein
MLTVKDFILYNSPCLFCNLPGTLTIRSSGTSNDRAVSIKKPSLSSEDIEVYLKITYASSLNLKINHTHNRFNSNNWQALTKYLKEYKMSMAMRCDTCGCFIKSKILQFDLDKKIIKPLEISQERLHVQNNDTFISLNSSYLDNQSILTATTKGKDGTTILKLPLNPLKKFKDREHFIKKMKTLLLFV